MAVGVFLDVKSEARDVPQRLTTRAAIDKAPKEKDLRMILLPGLQEAKELIRSYIRLFGSSGRVSGKASGQTSEIKHAE